MNFDVSGEDVEYSVELFGERAGVNVNEIHQWIHRGILDKMKPMTDLYKYTRNANTKNSFPANHCDIKPFIWVWVCLSYWSCITSSKSRFSRARGQTSKYFFIRSRRVRWRCREWKWLIIQMNTIFQKRTGMSNFFEDNWLHGSGWFRQNQPHTFNEVLTTSNNDVRLPEWQRFVPQSRRWRG